MIPIVSLANVLNALIAVLLALRIYAQGKTNPAIGTKGIVRYFTAFYLAFGLMWFLYGGPGVYVFGDYRITLVNFLADLLAYAAVAVGLQIPFFVLNRQSYGAMGGIVMITMGLIYFMGRLIDFSLHQQIVALPYVYWTPTFAPWLQALTGVATSIGAVIFALTFFALARKKKTNQHLARHSFLLAVGMTFVLVSSSIFFIFTQAGIGAAALASICSLLGLLLLYNGIPYDHRAV